MQGPMIDAPLVVAQNTIPNVAPPPIRFRVSDVTLLERATGEPLW